LTRPLIPTPAKSVRLYTSVLPTHLFSFQRSHIVETEPFQDTFGPKAQRKRPRLDVSSFEELGKATAETAAGDEMVAETMAEPGRRKNPLELKMNSLVLQPPDPS
jgi:nuclear GTP-binding protein